MPLVFRLSSEAEGFRPPLKKSPPTPEILIQKAQPHVADPQIANHRLSSIYKKKNKNLAILRRNVELGIRIAVYK